jgi:predicted Zn finger-like uncharacterized protein
MEVTCPQCEAKLNIPDGKIPKDQMVRINCPKCKGKITIEPDRQVEGEQSPNDSYVETGKFHHKFIESKGGEGGEKDTPDYDDYSSDEALDFFDEGIKPALVLIGDDIGERVKSSIEELGYKFISAPNTRDALGKMRFHHFDMVLLADGFDGQELENSPIINYLNHLSMSSRRRILFALIGEKFKTMDDMKAYALSANIVINSKDLDKLTSILKRGISDHQRFYKVFMDTLVEIGKA